MDRRTFFQSCAVLIGSTVLPVGCGGGSGSGSDAVLSIGDADIIDLSKSRFVDIPSTLFSVSHDSYGVIDLNISEIDDEVFSMETEQFSVVLSGPELPVLEEGRYQVYNESLSYIELYLQPGQSPAGEQLYRAMFSILQA